MMHHITLADHDGNLFRHGFSDSMLEQGAANAARMAVVNDLYAVDLYKASNELVRAYNKARLYLEA